MTDVIRTAARRVQQRTHWHWSCAAGAFISMMGASILLSGLSIFTAPIVSDLFYAKGPDGQVLTQTLPGGQVAPVEVNGGPGAFLLYFTLMTAAIVVPLMLFAGPLLAKFGARILLAVGGVAMAAGLAMFAISHSNLMFYAAGIIMGVGYGMSIAIIPPALVNAWFEEKRGLVLGIVLAGTGVGGLVWAAIGPSLARSEMGWRGVMWIMAASMLVCTLIPAAFLIRNRPADCGLVPYGSFEDPPADRLSPKPQAAGYTFAEARRSSPFWIACGSFFIFGLVVSVTQVLSIVFRTAAYENPLDEASWTPSQVAFYSSLFIVWLACLVLWKPLLGVLNDKIGLAGMLVVSMALMALAVVYLPSMVYGSSVALMYVAMVAMSSGISNATVTPPLVVAQAMGGRDFPKIFSLAVAFYYAGNALGAPIWGMLGTRGLTDLALYVSPALLAVFVLGSLVAVRKGRAHYLSTT